MTTWMLIVVLILIEFSNYARGYDPTEEVVSGSVLLPKSRRGRVLANLIRRQAVDGTGIFFNKDADGINARSKQRYNVLSDDLLPYIIAEQERRITLYKRVMTAIQNGEKGVTVIEFRNKTALLIRKGSLYRCPPNRPPLEPDGSGAMKCEDGAEPQEIVYDSCLNAEDKVLYNSGNNRYFFCNRYREEGPSIMESENKAILCAPNQRTSLSYTMSRCTIQGTNDVIMHYRYYPDHKYEKVYQMDPESEVCDHWRPCSIGYIFALPTPDQAVPATELWDDLKARGLFVEYVPPESGEYITSQQVFEVPPEYDYHELKYVDRSGNSDKIPIDMIALLAPSPPKERRRRSVDSNEIPDDEDSGKSESHTSQNQRFVQVRFPQFDPKYYGNYRAVLQKKGVTERKHVEIFSLQPSSVALVPETLEVIPGQKMEKRTISFTCDRKCQVTKLEVVGVDIQYAVPIPEYKYGVAYNDKSGEIILDLDEAEQQVLGNIFAYFDVSGKIEYVKVADVKGIKKPFV